MKKNKSIFCASNPAKLPDALWEVIRDDIGALSDLIIFLPSRRAVRTVEKMIVDKIGNAAVLPKLVALGEGVDDPDMEPDISGDDIVSNFERVIVLAKMLSGDPNVRTISNALPLASDMVRMQDYIENEGAGHVDWTSLVDEKYAAHFQKKAEFLTLADSVLPKIFPNKITVTQKRNADIRDWIDYLKNHKSKVIVCGSTASVPASADLMAHVANMPNGYIILPGKIPGHENVTGDCDPYASELKFLEKIGAMPGDIRIIDTGTSATEFLNAAFSNSGNFDPKLPVPNSQLIECNRESEEAECVAEIAARAVDDNKSVLVITPDAAGNQRIAAAFARRNLSADFSGGVSGAMTPIGRAILNWIDDLLEAKDKKPEIDNLFETIVSAIETNFDLMSPKFEIDDIAGSVLDAIKQASDVISRNGIVLNLADARAVIANAISGVSVRPPMNDNAKISVLGTIESRMQTADVVILTGLNEGMFPSRGYENAWLPRMVAEKIGLPPADRKVSLMAMDFMNLSCAQNVYWLRSRTAGSSQTTESRFLSRVAVANQSTASNQRSKILDNVRARDNVQYDRMDYSPPAPPADQSDVYVTELELLIHNPYAFYCRHILRLRPKNDYWAEPDARDFGNLVHKVIEESGIGNQKLSIDGLVEQLDEKAKTILEPGSVIFHFWHKRFVEIAPAIVSLFQESGIRNQRIEIGLDTIIAGRKARARADMVYDKLISDSCKTIPVVLDIKTGAAPNKSQLEQGNMPQLPLEAHMIGATVIQFLQLQNNNVKLIEYSGELAQSMINASLDKVSQLFGRYSKDYEPYEYYETSDPKYQVYDDFARVDD